MQLNLAAFDQYVEAHGYCIDDNARALMAMVRRGDGQSAALAPVYAAFIQHDRRGSLAR